MPIPASELNIPRQICGAPPALNQALQQITNILQQGEGGLYRFRLTSTLSVTSSAAAQIKRRIAGGWETIGTGTVYDEEANGGFFAGVNGDEGWCTAHHDHEGHYSIISMPEKMGPHRGIVTVAITKGDVITGGTVLRYKAGTEDEDSGATDTVFSDLTSVPVGKKIKYYGSGGKFWVQSVERVLAEIQLDMTEETSTIDALKVMAQIEAMGDEFWEEKIVIASCP